LFTLPALGESAEPPSPVPGSAPRPTLEPDSAATPEPPSLVADTGAAPAPSSPPAETLDDLCKIDPAACPKLDPSQEPARPEALKLAAYDFAYHPGEKAKESIVLPSGHAELAGEMVFITSEPYLTPEDTKLTDVALFRASARRSFSDALELYLDTKLLAKQPSDTDELVWQGSGVAVRGALGRHFAAGLGAGGGPLLGDAGYYWSVHPQLFAKATPDRHLRFLMSLGTSFTFLELGEPIDDRWWFEDVGAGFEAQLGGGDGACWVGIDYAVPVFRGGSAEADLFDPEVRIDLEVGGVLTFSEWDVFSSYTFVDRGELGSPETMLPILDGGFDQRQLLLGVSYRFEPKRERPRY
jgi:hypothetical protein